jgi:ABC-type dipeptide/oligopeptide/nickel transport system permease component
MVSPLPQSQASVTNSSSLTPEETAAQKAREQQMKTIIAAVIVAAVVILTGLGFAVYVLLQPGTPTDRIRDIFIIIVALESFVIGIALVILLIQLASLINLLQNEVRPIIQATNETINTLRGTAEFLGESVVEPVIKLNGYLASIQRVLELMGLKQK